MGRKNISLDDVISIQKALKRIGSGSNSELILPIIIYCCYNGDTFKELFRYLEGIDCGSYGLCYSLLWHVDKAPEAVRAVFSGFISDTKKELWDTEDGIYKHYLKGSNFDKLLSQEEGCNLLQKYNGIFFSSSFEGFLEYIFSEAGKLLNEKGISYDEEAVGSIRRYILDTRKGILDLIDKEAVLELPYDIDAWRKEQYRRPLSEYKRKTALKIFKPRNRRR